MLWTTAFIILLIDEPFSGSLEDIIYFTVVTLIWGSACLKYNFVRYQKLKSGLLNYNMRVYVLTLLLPLFSWYIIFLFVCMWM